MFYPDEGYIIADSEYNSINYNGDRMSIHVRSAEVSNPDYEYFYDRIYIIDSKGDIIGHFWFRDLAVYISGIGIGFYKHWKYFKFFFNFVEQVYVTQKRLVVVFPTTSPLGSNVVQTAPFTYEIDPEYLPENKIRSSVLAYNFNTDKTYDNENIDYKITDPMFKGRDMFYYESPDGIASWNHVMNFKTLRNFNTMEAKVDTNTEDDKPTYLYELMQHLVDCFEEIMYLPDSLLDMKDYIESVPVGEESKHPFMGAAPPERTFKNLTTSRGACGMTAFMHAAGFWFFPKIQPTMIYVGSDSSIIAVNLKTSAIDEYLDANLNRNSMIQKSLRDYPEIANAYAVLNDLKDALTPDKTISFSKYSTNLFDVFVRTGPHCYLYISPSGIAYPIIEYTEQAFFFNDKKVASGDMPYLKGQILNLYGKKFLKIGSRLYKDLGGVPYKVEPYSPEAFDYRIAQELEEFEDYDNIIKPTKYFNTDFFVGKKDDNYILMADWLNKRFVKNSFDKVEPVVTFGDKLLIGVSEQGSLDKMATFYSMRGELIFSEKETPETDLVEAVPDTSFFFFFKNLRKSIERLEAGYKGFFAEATDGNKSEWFFMNPSGMKISVKNVYNPSVADWKVINADDLDSNTNDGWCVFNDFIEEDKKGKHTIIHDKLDGIKVIGGEII